MEAKAVGFPGDDHSQGPFFQVGISSIHKATLVDVGSRQVIADTL